MKTLMKSITIGLVAILTLLILTSCNLRENLLLPPNIIPEDYVESSYIYSVSNYMVKSTNDDAFLYINQAAIADSLIRMQDTIVFERAIALTERDTIHVNTTAELSAAYHFYIYRDSVMVQLSLDPEYPNITIYAPKTGNQNSGQSYCLNQYIWLDAIPVTPDDYTSRRISFHPYGTGTNQLVSINPQNNDLAFTAIEGNHYAFMLGSQDRTSYFLPVTTADTAINISSLESLDATSAARIQHVFPAYTVFSSITNVTASAALGDGSSAPLMKLHNSVLPNRYPMQWIMQSSTQVYALQESADTWQMTGNDLIAPCRVNGNYLLITPLESQSSLTLPLDAGFNKVYAVDFWLDLTDVEIANTTLTISTPTGISSSFQSYVSGNPYQLNSQHNLYNFSFCQDGTEISALPDSQWVEIGFPVTNSSTANRLMRYYGTSARDAISYKTYASAFDATHYVIQDDVLYASLSQSGEYLYADIDTDPSAIRIPAAKTGGEFQTDRVFAYWDGAQKRQFSYFTLDYLSSYSTPNPWFNGSPFQMAGYRGFIKSYFESSGVVTDAVPTTFYLEYDIPVTQTFGQMVLYSALNSSYLAALYKTSGTADAGTFTQNSDRITCYPVSGGTHILANITNLNSAEKYVTLYKTMSVDFGDLKLWMQSAQEPATGTNLHITAGTAFADPLNVISSQYTLTRTSPVYSIAAEVNGVPSSTFYDQHTPLIYLKRTTRRVEQLFTLNRDTDYRIYTYDSGTTADGYHYVSESNYNRFLLVHNGQFATYTDDNPHTQIARTLATGAQDFVMSLYQAEFILPDVLAAQPAFAGFQFYLNKVTNLANLPGAISATALRILNSSNQLVNPGFLSNFVVTRYPVLYIPFPAEYADQNLNLFYVNTSNVTSQFTEVETITGINQFIIYGNCAICLVDNPGSYYLAPAAKHRKLK